MPPRRGASQGFNQTMDRRVYAIATMDTKGQELAFLAERLRAAGVDVVTVDVGTLSSPTAEPDVDRATVAGDQPQGHRIKVAVLRSLGKLDSVQLL